MHFTPKTIGTWSFIKQFPFKTSLFQNLCQISYHSTILLLASIITITISVILLFLWLILGKNDGQFPKASGVVDSRLDSVRCIVWVHCPINVPFIHLWKLCLKSNCKITNKTWTSPKSDQIGTPQAPKVYQIYRIWCLHICLVFVLCVPLSKFPKSDLRLFGDSLEKLGNSFKALTPLYIRNCFLHLFICIIYVSVLSVKSFLRLFKLQRTRT